MNNEQLLKEFDKKFVDTGATGIKSLRIFTNNVDGKFASPSR